MTKKALTQDELTQLTQGLHKLAHNLWWTWNQEAQEIFQELSPRGWQNLYHNAVAVLHEVSDYELRVRLQDQDFAERVREVLRQFRRYLKDKETWAHQNAPALRKNPVAYFSAEFGFTKPCRSPRAAWEFWPATTPNPPATSDSALSGSACSIAKAIFSRRSTRTTGRPSIIRCSIPKNLPIEPVLEHKGRAAGLHGRDRHDRGFLPGLAGQRRARVRFICSTPTGPRTSNIFAI